MSPWTSHPPVGVTLGPISEREESEGRGRAVPASRVSIPPAQRTAGAHSDRWSQAQSGVIDNVIAANPLKPLGARPDLSASYDAINTSRSPRAAKNVHECGSRHRSRPSSDRAFTVASSTRLDYMVFSEQSLAFRRRPGGCRRFDYRLLPRRRGAVRLVGSTHDG
jgi:hypothetical protein